MLPKPLIFRHTHVDLIVLNLHTNWEPVTSVTARAHMSLDPNLGVTMIQHSYDNPVLSVLHQVLSGRVLASVGVHLMLGLFAAGVHFMRGLFAAAVHLM